LVKREENSMMQGVDAVPFNVTTAEAIRALVEAAMTWGYATDAPPASDQAARKLYEAVAEFAEVTSGWPKDPPWLPIETAPRDGRRVLVWRGNRPELAHFGFVPYREPRGEKCWHDGKNPLEETTGYPPRFWFPLTAPTLTDDLLASRRAERIVRAQSSDATADKG
jgi:hypothetical protein